MSDASKEPIWLTMTQVRLLHADTLQSFGGAPGLRDEGLLQSALAKPQNVYAYGGSPSIYELVAAYGYGLAKNHAFVDGNKRTALLAMRAFLFRNGYLLNPDQADVVAVMEGVAGGIVTQEILAGWIRDNTSPRE